MILSLESQAPAIKVQNWLRGEALANFQPNYVYVLEFFGTSCPHCVKAMPNLVQLQEKYRAAGWRSLAWRQVKKLQLPMRLKRIWKHG